MAILRVKDDEGNIIEIPAIKGDAFTYEDFTPEQLDTLKSEIADDVVDELTRSTPTLPTTLVANTIYDLGEQENLIINLPTGQLGDFIEVDFLSTTIPTTLTITSTSGLSDYDLIPEANTIYSLYFNWIRLDATTYGWGFGYAEYTRTVTE